MHVLDRPHLARMMSLSIVAALLAVVVTLLLAAGLGDVTGAGGTTATPRIAAVPATGSRATPPWLGNPFTMPLVASVAQPWDTTRR